MSNLPESFGVYIMKNIAGEIIYIGKAINLRKRVSSYFQKKHDNLRLRLLVENIHIIDYITVSNESEALILEANLIKKHSPHFNVQFKDNKFYPFIRVTTFEDYPRILYTRNNPKDGSLYFGPYVSAHNVRRVIEEVQMLFKLRTCKEMPKRECLNYHIHRCSAPCIGKISMEEYRLSVDEGLKFIRGDYDELLKDLDKQMRRAAKELLFEKAQAMKEKIEAIRLFEAGQHVYFDSKLDAEFIAAAERMNRMLFVVNIIRAGKMVGKRSYNASIRADENPADIIGQFLAEYYLQSDRKSSVLVIEPQFAENLPALNGFFRDSGIELSVIVPQDKDMELLVRMARENAELHLMQFLSKVDKSESLLLLQETLGMDKLPMRIEGFDIANILGENAVASMVSFYGAAPDKKSYRRFKIKTKTTPDDFAMMYEAVFRRYKRLKEESGDFPDLILIDGGKGQLHSAMKVMDELGLKLNVISLAKRNEEIYMPTRENPIVLPKNSPALHILQQVRDESHRFANTYYTKLKTRELLKSALDGIEGIGEKRRAMLLKKYISREAIVSLTAEQLAHDGIPKQSAEKVYNRLKELYN